MDSVYSWRLGRYVKALDEAEYAHIRAVYLRCRELLDLYQRRLGLPRWKLPEDRVFEPVRREYARMTGELGLPHTDILRLRLSEFGPPCAYCGRNLRTPRSSHCYECGADREASAGDRAAMRFASRP